MFKSDVPGLTQKRVLTFTLGFFCYVCVHCSRSSWAYVSGEIADLGTINGFDSQFLGYANFTFLACLGGNMLLLGQLGDKINVKYFALSGLGGLGIIFIIMALLYQYSTAQNYVYLILVAIAGCCCATPWPGLLSIINQWFPKEQSALTMGLFAASINFGNMVGFFYSGLTYEVMGEQLYVSIYISGTLTLISTTLSLLFLTPSPSEEFPEVTVSDSNKVEEVKEEQEEMSVLKAWGQQGVAIYAVAFGCTKAVYQVLGFWLPNYLDTLNVQDVAFINMMVDLGAMIGGVGMCYLGLKFKKRATLIVPSLWLGTIFMIAINFLKHYEDPVAGYAILSFFTGLFIGGCYNNISSAIAVELSNREELKKYKNASSTIVSIIVGYGTTYVAFTMLLIPYVKQQLFLYCGGQAILGGLLLIPVILNEWKPTQEDQEYVQKEVEMS